MIHGARYLSALVGRTVWHGGRTMGAALRKLPQVTGGVYDREARDWARAMLRAARVTVRVEGDLRPPDGGTCVYVSNHVSFLDILALLAELPGTVRFVFKAELMRIPVFGGALRASGHIRIERTNRAAAFTAYHRAAEALRQGRSAVVFAEGTRSRDGTLLPFKRGPFVLAIAGQVPVVPVRVVGAWELQPKGKLIPRSGTVTLRAGAPIGTVGMDYEDREELTRQAFLAVEALGDTDSTDFTDCTDSTR